VHLEQKEESKEGILSYFNANERCPASFWTGTLIHTAAEASGQSSIAIGSTGQ